jgi:hypothetical protein
MKFALIATIAAASANELNIGIPPVGMTFNNTVVPVLSAYDKTTSKASKHPLVR